MITGSLVAIITPMREDGSLDLARLEDALPAYLTIALIPLLVPLQLLLGLEYDATERTHHRLGLFLRTLHHLASPPRPHRCSLPISRRVKPMWLDSEG